MNYVIVYGSLNYDISHHVSQHPKPGETIRVRKSTSDFGGKGANQAIAAQRAGSKVVMVGAVGNDKEGETIIEHMQKEGVITDNIIKMELETGKAQIVVDSSGENIIYIIPGANDLLSFDKDQVDAEYLDKSKYILFQNEINMNCNLNAMKYFHDLGKKIVWDPAPFEKFPLELLKNIHILVPNETELEQLVPNKRNNLERAKHLLTYGVKHVLVTLGEKGSLYVSDEIVLKFEVPSVEAIDTVAAGDTFGGYFISFLNQGYSLIESIQYAHKASSIAITRLGAQTSIPTKSEVLSFKEDVTFEEVRNTQ